MPHVNHIAQHKALLDARWQILRLVRSFFWEQGFHEVETPCVVHLPGQEPNIEPETLIIHDEQGKSYSAYLHTSPEYTMKKMLAAGYETIFFLGKVFRDKEGFGGMHNPEFTMLEWYRTGVDFNVMMEDVEDLIGYVSAQLYNSDGKMLEYAESPMIQKIHMRDLWKQVISIDLDQYLKTDAMRDLCIRFGYEPSNDERYEELFYRIFLNKIEPALKDMGVVMIHHYPAQMASLAKLSDMEKGYAERVEIYADGIEIANGFSELTDAGEQRQRLREEREYRKKSGSQVYDIDEEFIDAVGQLPRCAGMALGIDRLIMILTKVEFIEHVLPLPASVLWPSSL